MPEWPQVSYLAGITMSPPYSGFGLQLVKYFYDVIDRLLDNKLMVAYWLYIHVNNSLNLLLKLCFVLLKK
jgi:hypothetical protein